MGIDGMLGGTVRDRYPNATHMLMTLARTPTLLSYITSYPKGLTVTNELGIIVVLLYRLLRGLGVSLRRRSFIT